VVYARIHQLGGKAGRGHAVTLPARPYIGISEDDIKEARAIIRDHMVAVLGGGR
jgi:phage virion morphogenesis protein